MLLTSKLLYHLLSEQYPLVRYGRRIAAEQEIRLPIFYNRSVPLHNGGVYITRVQELPEVCAEICIFICLGGGKIGLPRGWSGEVLCVQEPGLDILSLFNTVIGFYNRILQWDRAMEQLLEDHAPIEEFVRISIPLFNNCISIADYNLNLLVNSDLGENNGHPEIQISREFDRIPDAISLEFKNIYMKHIQYREPFFYKGQREDPEGNNYCINLYLGNTYIGTCVLWSKMRPLQESDFILFQHFSEYMRKVLSASSSLLRNRIATMKTIFSALLQCFPVSIEEYAAALELQELDMLRQGVTLGVWQCAVIRSANQGKTLPESYLCESIEDMLPNSAAIAYEGQIVCLCMIPEGESCEDTVCDILLPYLQDMNFRMGLSEPIEDIFETHDFYLQALAILETGFSLSPQQYIYRFADYVLPYMLENAVGSFKPDMMLTNGLQKLQSSTAGVDYWETLLCYLDNECNASRTAQDLFLHRSSLLPRLDKIKSMVDMDTPEQRLYLRMCIYLDKYRKEIRGNRK